MSLFPWDNWFYNLSAKRKEVNSLHSQAVFLQNVVSTDVTSFNVNLDKYKQLLAYNSALVLIPYIVTLSDQKLADYTQTIDALPAQGSGSVPIKVASAITELTGSLLVLKAILNIGKLVKAGLFSDAAGGEGAGEAVAQSLSEAGTEAGIETGGVAIGEGLGEAGIEAAIEGASFGALAETGIGIFAAVGLDAIFGAINGAKESSELDNEINKLKRALSQLQMYDKKITSAWEQVQHDSGKEITRFGGLVSALSKFDPPNFEYKYPGIFVYAPWVLTAQYNALQQYGVLVKMRNAYATYATGAPNLSKEFFLFHFRMYQAPQVSMDVINKYWAVLAQYSTLMSKAA